MATKTSVTGNRVTINDCSYDLKPAGTDRYAVCDEFGASLGWITMKGKKVEADDFGVPGAHQLLFIGKLWSASVSSEPTVAKPCFMVCRVATSQAPEEAEIEPAKAHAAWLKQQPGAKAAFVTHDAESKTMLSISVWSGRAKMSAAIEQPAPEGASEPASAKVEVVALAADF